MYPSIDHKLAQTFRFYYRRELGNKKCGSVYTVAMYLNSEQWWEDQFRQHKLLSDLDSAPDL